MQRKSTVIAGVFACSALLIAIPANAMKLMWLILICAASAVVQPVPTEPVVPTVAYQSDANPAYVAPEQSENDRDYPRVPYSR